MTAPPTDDHPPSRDDELLEGWREIMVDRPDGASVYARMRAPEAAASNPDAPALLILDGIGCSGWAFRQIAPTIAAQHRVVLMHYRGHGRSPDPPRPWHLAMVDLADDAAAVLDALGIGRCVAVGFSMGFQVALELYRRDRGRVAALASLAGPSGRVLETFQGTHLFGHALPLLRSAIRHASDLTSRVWRAVLPSPWVVDLGLATSLNADRIKSEDFAFYLDQMAAMNPELFFDMLHRASRHTADDLLPEIQVPALVVAGKLDRFVPLSTMRRIAFAIPNAEWIVLEDATHAVPAEYPGVIAQRLLELTARAS